MSSTSSDDRIRALSHGRYVIAWRSNSEQQYAIISTAFSPGRMRFYLWCHHCKAADDCSHTEAIHEYRQREKN